MPGEAADAVSEYERAPLVLEGEGAGRLARHPNVPFVLAVPAGLERQHELADEIEQRADLEQLRRYTVSYQFMGDGLGIFLQLTGGLPDPNGYLRGAVKGLTGEELGRMMRTGSGNEVEVSFEVERDGMTMVTRVLFVPGRAARIHGVMVQVATVGDVAPARSIASSLRRERGW